MSYFFSTPVDIDIILEDTDNRQMVDIKTDKQRREKAPLYMDGESVRGQSPGLLWIQLPEETPTDSTCM